MSDRQKDIEQIVLTAPKLSNTPHLPQYGCLTAICKKKKCCHKYKKKGKHCGGCPKK